MLPVPAMFAEKVTAASTNRWANGSIFECRDTVRKTLTRTPGPLARVLIDKSLFGVILLLTRSFCQPTQKETPTMHPPDGLLERLHSLERKVDRVGQACVLYIGMAMLR